MDEKILGSVSDLSLKFFNNKLHYYNEEMEMKISSNEDEDIHFSLCQDLRILLEWY